MTQGEFAAGWKLLILQPWGWRYRSLTKEGKPSEESRIQMELYYSKLKWAHPSAWMHVANLFVEGDKWPSIHELKESLMNVNHRYVKALPGGNVERMAPINETEAKEILTRILGREWEEPTKKAKGAA